MKTPELNREKKEAEEKETKSTEETEIKRKERLETIFTRQTGHRFIRNDDYFTICVYTFLLVVICTLAIKAIVAFSTTKSFLASLFQAMAPFLIALLIAYIFTPFVSRVNLLLKRCFRKLNETIRMVLSLLIVYAIAIGLLVALLVFVLPQVVSNLMELIGKIPEAYSQLVSIMTQLQESHPKIDLSGIINALENTQSTLTSSLTDITKVIIPTLYNASVSLVQWFANFIIAIVVSVYMLYGKKALKRIIKIVLHTFLPEKNVPVVKEILTDCSHIFSQYVVSKLIDSVIIGILCAILMTILGLRYVFLVSIIVGVTNMIPYFGPFIGAIPGLIMELVAGPIKALIFLIMILCLQQFDGLYLGPKLMGNSTGMRPIWIIFAITIGGQVFGVVGMFLGVPVFAILTYLGSRFASARLARKHMVLEDIQ